MRHLFGTDGMRGVAGEYPLDDKTTYSVGVALGKWIAARGLGKSVVIGMDTRESGPRIAAHVAGGLATEGVTTRFAGLITTPGVAWAARTGDFSAGVMISASHNPYQDNGIKLIDHSGFKFPDAEELLIEKEIFALTEQNVTPVPAELTVDEGLDTAYIDFLASTFPHRLDGMRLVVDCANGAAAYLAPDLLQRLGAAVDPIGCSPDGRNINLHCGSLHLDLLKARVLETGADLGVAFDGDADRALFVSHSGKIVDGDAVMLLTGLSLHAKGKLDVVVATVMSNLGLERALSAHGIGLVRTPVGDKYVLEEMLARNAPLGGEQSGHLIFREYATTGDGLLTALRVLEAIRESGQDLDALTAQFKVYPQLLVNVRVKTKRPLAELTQANEEIRAAEQEFGDTGRILVRFSGTEPLARVMVEGPELDRVQARANAIADAIRAELGS